MNTLTIISRADAKAKGLKRYFTGKPCVNGHVSERYAGGACVACQAMHYGAAKADGRVTEWRDKSREVKPSRDREYRAKNKDAINARRADKYLADPTRQKAARSRAATWYAANKARALDATRAWAGANRGKVRATKSSYKVRRKAIERIQFSDFDQFAFEEAHELVLLREAHLGGKWHVDHMIPLFAKDACGLHVAANFAVIPDWINVSKQNRMMYTETGSWLRAV